MQYEDDTKHTDSVALQESEVQKLARAMGPMQNTVIPTSILTGASSHYQAHLERISDYVAKGPGVWWKHTTKGIEFLDGDSEVDHKTEGPNLMHFRSVSMADVDFYLHEQWEACCTSKVQLPATMIRHYAANGELTSLLTFSEQPTEEVTPCRPTAKVAPSKTLFQPTEVTPSRPPSQPPLQPKVIPSQPPSQPEVTHSQPPSQPEITPSRPPSQRKVTPSRPSIQPEVTPTRPPLQQKVTPSRPSLQPEVIPLRPPSQPEVTPSRPSQPPLQPKVIPSRPHLQPEVTPSPPLSQSKVTSSRPHSQPKVTPSRQSDVTPLQPASQPPLQPEVTPSEVAPSQPPSQPVVISSHATYATTTAKLLSKIIADDHHTIKQFDCLRSQLKSNTRHSNAKEELYCRLRDNLKNKVILSYRISTKVITEWEELFTKNKGRSPTKDDSTPHIIQHHRIRELSQKLLKHEWQHTMDY